MSAAMTACVVPPPLEVDETDAGLNSPPIFLDVFDAAGMPRRPPDTLTVATSPAVLLDVTLFDLDVTDELTVKLFVDYDITTPEPARVTCLSPGSAEGETVRPNVKCTTSGLCQGAASHRLEFEVYDRPPDVNAPYRDPAAPGMFSTWTFDLNCIDPT